MSKPLGTLIKVIKATRDLPDTNERHDILQLIYRDQEGNKKVKFIERAETPYYVIKDKNSKEAGTPPLFIEENKVEKFITYSDQLYREMAVQANIMNFYSEVQISRGPQSWDMKNIFKHKYFYDSDMDIADRYIAKFYEDFDPDPEYTLKKTFFDIEVDLMPEGYKKNKDGTFGYIGFPEEEDAPVPINIITMIDEESRTVHSFILRNKLNPQIQELENNINPFKAELIETIKQEGYEIKDIKFHFLDKEEELVINFFDLTHKIDPDYSLSWNSSFDIQTMQNRMIKAARRNGARNDWAAKAEADEILSDSKYRDYKDSSGRTVSFPTRTRYNAKKNRDFQDRIDEFTILDGINWMDQMLYYANIRKGSGKKDSYALDEIALEEIDREKLEFEPGETIKELPWRNFKKFVSYNIQDVVLLAMLEDNNSDMDLVQKLTEVTNTRQEKVFAKTISIKNFINKFAKDNNFIMTNNRNSSYGEFGESFDRRYLQKGQTIETDPAYKFYFELKDNYGGYVADPRQNSNKNGTVINNKKSRYLFDYVFDLDYSSLYPSIIRALNIDTTTLIGKFYMIDNRIKARLVEEYDYDGVIDISGGEANVTKYVPGEVDSEGLNVYDGTNDLAPSLVDSLHSHDFVATGEKFFGLPTTESLLNKIQNEYNRD